MKETFIIRTEWHQAISELKPLEQAIIFQNLFHYHEGNENLINLNNLSVKLVWRLIEPNLKRNILNYDKRSVTSSENGKKGGRPLKINKEEKPNNLIQKPIETKKPIESLSVSVSVSDNKKIQYRDNVKLSESENLKLVSEHGQDFTDSLYDYLHEYKIEKGYKTKSDYHTILRWVIDAVNKKQGPYLNGNAKKSNWQPSEKDSY